MRDTKKAPARRPGRERSIYSMKLDDALNAKGIAVVVDREELATLFDGVAQGSVSRAMMTFEVLRQGERLVLLGQGLSDIVTEGGK